MNEFRCSVPHLSQIALHALCKRKADIPEITHRREIKDAIDEAVLVQVGER